MVIIGETIDDDYASKVSSRVNASKSGMTGEEFNKLHDWDVHLVTLLKPVEQSVLHRALTSCTAVVNSSV